MSEILIEAIRTICETATDRLLSEEEQFDARCGDYGQWDDTFDAGVDHGEAEMATRIISLINAEGKQ